MFDNPRTSWCRDSTSPALIGFDVTEFLDHELTRTPVTLYLFHLVRQLLDGRRLVCWMDEFWRLLADPAFESFAKDGPKTWRKLNGVMALATQSPSDVLSVPISRTIIEQTPTKIFFPNADANAEEYMRRFWSHRAEFQLMKEELEPGSRRFLVNQGHRKRRLRARLEGLRCGARGDLRPAQRPSSAWSDHRPLRRVAGGVAAAFLSTRRSGDAPATTLRRPLMSLKAFPGVLLLGVLSLAGIRPAQAQFAVIDVAAIAQLVQEVQQLEQQVATARSQLLQAQTEYAAITGNRGMQNLLAGTLRNYLPTDWTQLSQVMSVLGELPALASSMSSLVSSNAVLTPAQVAALSPVAAGAACRSPAEPGTAAGDVTARRSRTPAAALPRSSSLISAIGTATDQKASLDLRRESRPSRGCSRTSDEAPDALSGRAGAGVGARCSGSREQAIVDQGSLRTLSPMGL